MVLQVTPVDRCPILSDAKDCTKWTPTAPEGQYVRMALEGKAINALYDTGSNCTIISKALAKQLGVKVLEY